MENTFSSQSGKSGLPVRLGWACGSYDGSLPWSSGSCRYAHTDPLSLLSGNDDFARLWNAEHIERHHGGQVKKIILDECYHMITVNKLRQDMVQHTVQFSLSLKCSLEDHDVEQLAMCGAVPSHQRGYYQ